MHIQQQLESPPGEFAADVEIGTSPTRLIEEDEIDAVQTTH